MAHPRSDTAAGAPAVGDGCEHGNGVTVAEVA